MEPEKKAHIKTDQADKTDAIVNEKERARIKLLKLLQEESDELANVSKLLREYRTAIRSKNQTNETDK